MLWNGNGRKFIHEEKVKKKSEGVYVFPSRFVQNPKVVRVLIRKSIPNAAFLD